MNMKLLRLMCALLTLSLLALCPQTSLAECYWGYGGAEDVTMTISSPITIDPNWTVGSVIASSTVTSPNPSNSLVYCEGTSPSGVYNLVGAQGSGNETVFPTGVAGVGYRVLHPDKSRILPAYPNGSIPSGLSTLSLQSALELVVTGKITNKSTLPATTLGYWQFGALKVENFILGNSVIFKSPTCTVNTQSIAVTLPTVAASALGAKGATAGATDFTISLNCISAAAGQTLSMQFDTAFPTSDTNGIIPVNSGSTTANVGVQLTDAMFNPVTFGTAKTVGSTVTGTNNFTYYARYYATATPVRAGKLTATATFTLSYD